MFILAREVIRREHITIAGLRVCLVLTTNIKGNIKECYGLEHDDKKYR